MRSLIAAVALVLTASSSIAQPTYSEIVEKQKLCELTGELWQESFEKGTVLGKPMTHYANERQQGKLTHDQFFHFAMIFVSAPHNNEKFRTGRDAYMAGWAECMDKARKPAR